ncbi:MAG: UDP-glucose 4-epimerase GalE [Candidatus Levybacteria bacterium RIFCSPHIGHO2_01_FULL_37_17]|nr:MAG: UDP-glucose 4-epimerase GalE [Candidatus Levybacteria bacterium RIFCSPHIGHO2_01_FULL_37_17]
MKILVTGGAGYIGQFMVKRLIENGDEPVVLDSLEVGHREAVPQDVRFYEGNLLDKEFVKRVFAENPFDAVIHFAAYALAGESMEKPEKYFENNIQGGLNLLDVMKGKTSHFIFSSTCSIYGTPDKIPVTEEETKKPESVYGQSKLMFEKVLYWYDKIYNIKHVNLRYFNAAGAALDGLMGENHETETHIIPNAINAILQNKPFTLFGKDYPTPDGTCIRDYIHVLDLAEAHLQAFSYLKDKNTSDSFNLGSGKGYSNLEVLEMVKKVSGKSLEIEYKDRRFGDPPKIFADNSKAKEVLGFDPKNSDLETVVSSAYKWHSRT